MFPSTGSRVVPGPLRLRPGIPGDRVAYVPEDLEGAYTAGPIAGLQAIRSGRLGQERTTLVLAAGAGITVAIALTARTAPAEPVPARKPPPGG